MVLVRKTNDKVRICVDFTESNWDIKSKVYPTAHVASSKAELENGSIFTNLNANSGFYQIPLSSEAKLLATLLTQFGRFAFI